MAECLTLDWGTIINYYGDNWDDLCCYTIPSQTYDDFVSGLTEYYNNACLKDRVFSDYVTRLYNNCLSGVSSGITGVYVTGGTADGSNDTLVFTNSSGGTFTVENSALLFNDAYVSGGTLDSATGCVTFVNTSGGTFQVCGFDGFTSYWSANTDGSISTSAHTDILLHGASDTTYPLTIERDNNGHFLKFRDNSHIQQDYTFESESSGTFYGLNLKNKDGDTIVNFAANAMLGIGTIDPTVAIDIDSALSAADALQVRISGKGGIGHTNAGQTRTIIGNSYKNAATRFGVTMGGYTTADELLTIMGTGNVGVGTVDETIQARLHVSGATILTGDVGISGNTNIGTTLGVSGNTNIAGTLSALSHTNLGSVLGVSGRTYLGTIDAAGAGYTNDEILVRQSNKAVEYLTIAQLKQDIADADYWSANTDGTSISPSGSNTTTAVNLKGNLGVSGRTYLGTVDNATPSPTSAERILVKQSNGEIESITKAQLTGLTDGLLWTANTDGSISTSGVTEVKISADTMVEGNVTLESLSAIGGSISINDIVYQNDHFTVVNGKNFRANGDVYLGNQAGDVTTVSGYVGISGDTNINGVLSGNTDARFAGNLGVSGKTYLGSIDAATATASDKILIVQSDGEIESITTGGLTAFTSDYWIEDGTGTGIKPSGTTTNVTLAGNLSVTGGTYSNIVSAQTQHIAGPLGVSGRTYLGTVDAATPTTTDNILIVQSTGEIESITTSQLTGFTSDYWIGDGTGTGIKPSGTTTNVTVDGDLSVHDIFIDEGDKVYFDGTDASPNTYINKLGTGLDFIIAGGQKLYISPTDTLLNNNRVKIVGDIIGTGDLGVSGDTNINGVISGNTHARFGGVLGVSGKTYLGTVDAATATPTDKILIVQSGGLVESITTEELTGFTSDYWEVDGTGTGIQPSGTSTTVNMPKINVDGGAIKYDQTGGVTFGEDLGATFNYGNGDTEFAVLGGGSPSNTTNKAFFVNTADGGHSAAFFTNNGNTTNPQLTVRGSVAISGDTNINGVISGNTNARFGGVLGISGKTYLGSVDAATATASDKILITQSNGEVEYITTGALTGFTADYWVADGTGTGIEPSGTTTSVSIKGNLGISGNTYWPDNGTAIFGAANDLKIYHSGSHSIIQDTGTGDLHLKGTAVKIRGTSVSEDIAVFTQNAGVELYYDNVKKFETGDYGISAYTSLLAGDLGVSGDTNINGVLSGNTDARFTGNLGVSGRTYLGTVDSATATASDKILIVQSTGEIETITTGALTGFTSDYWSANTDGTSISPSGSNTTTTVKIKGNLGVTGKTELGNQLLLNNQSGGIASPTPQIQFKNYYDNTGGPSVSHIDLYNGMYGFGVSNGDLDYISNIRHRFYSNTTAAADAYPAMTIDGQNNTVGINIATGGVASYILDVHGTLGVTGDTYLNNDLFLDSDSAVINMGDGNDATLTHDGTTGLVIAASPISINSTGDLTLDSSTDIVLDAAGGNIEFKDSTTLVFTIDIDTSAGDAIFKDAGSTEIFRIDGSEDSLLMATDRKIQFADTGEYIVSDGTDLTIASGTDIILNPTQYAGVGIVAPTTKLHIVETEEGDDPLRVQTVQTGEGYMLLIQSDGVVKQSTRITADSSGNVGISGDTNVNGHISAATNVHVNIDLGISGRTNVHGILSAGTGVVVTGEVGIGTVLPMTALDVHHNPTGLATHTGGGEVVTFGSGTLVKGKLHYMNTSGAWILTNANTVGLGSSELIGIALGTSVSAGVLLRGFFDMTSFLGPGSFNQGVPLYVSGTVGSIAVTQPAGSTDFVRVVGYCTNTANVIYFNPDGTYIKIA